MMDRGKYMDAISALEGLFSNSRQLSESEWHEVGEVLTKLSDKAHGRARVTAPQPLMGSTGYAKCSVNCTLFSSYMDPDTRSSRCLSGDGHPTREGVPCTPWVEHFVNERRG
jgi:hypothetical protein